MCHLIVASPTEHAQQAVGLRQPGGFAQQLGTCALAAAVQRVGAQTQQLDVQPALFARQRALVGARQGLERGAPVLRCDG